MADYQGIPGIAPDGWGVPSNEIMSPENIQYHYDENRVLKVDAVAYDSRGNIPADDPAPENQGDNFHRAQTRTQKIPVVSFQNVLPDGTLSTKEGDSSGICTRAGYDPDGNWYNVGDPSGSPSGQQTPQAGAVAKLAKIRAIVLGS